jgi:flavin reductase (DIM6/NTAB) family NADH-FMN oxidoreductase RutF
VTTTTARFEPATLRHVFGAFPTGVAVIAARIGADPTGMAVSSFTSVSLNPPLVSVCVASKSRTWPTLREATRIGVSVLAETHEHASRTLSAADGDRFAALNWRQTGDNALLLHGAAAWLDCSVEREIEAGDHVIALLEVHDLGSDTAVAPLVFHASRYRILAP